MESTAIWHPQATARIYLRKQFSLHSTIEDARLECTLNGAGFEVSLDGNIVGCGPGTIDGTPVWRSVDLEDIAPGAHELVVLADGGGIESRRPWFRCRGTFGSEGELASDATWEASPAGEDLSGESHVAADDPRLPVPEEENRGGRSWVLASRVHASEVIAALQPAAPVREVGIRAARFVYSSEEPRHGEIFFSTSAQTVMTTAKCVHGATLVGEGHGRAAVQTRTADRAVVIVIDFGRVVSGRPRLQVRTVASGGTIELFFSTDGTVVAGKSRYSCRAGAQEWTGLRLQRCRYLALRLSHFTLEAQLECVELRAAQVLTPMASTFALPQDLQSVWSTGERAVTQCRHETYVIGPPDAPFDWKRAAAIALNDYYLSGDCATSRTTLLAHASSVQSDIGLALFASNYYRFSGDGDTLGFLTPALDGLLCQKTSTNTVDHTWWAGGLQLLAALSRELGDDSRARRVEVGTEVARAGLERAWCAEVGLYSDGEGDGTFSQWTNGLILYFELAHGERRERILDGLRTATAPSTYLEAHYTVGGLWRAGAEERALEFTRNWWGRVAGRKGLTWLDKIDASEHVGFEVPGAEWCLGSYLLGVRPATPGFGAVEVRPPAMLTGGARGKIATSRGSVEVDWVRRQPGGPFTLTVDLKGPSVLHLRLPRPGKFPAVQLNGEPVWRNEKMIPNSLVRQVAADDDEITLIIQGAGHYQTRVE